MNCKERLKDYLDGYSSQYNFKDENDIKHDLNSNIEEMLKQNQKLEQALDEIEKIILKATTDEETGKDLGYSDKIPYDDLFEIIQKAKGDVKNGS